MTNPAERTFHPLQMRAAGVFHHNGNVIDISLVIAPTVEETYVRVIEATRSMQDWAKKVEWIRDYPQYKADIRTSEVIQRACQTGLLRKAQCRQREEVLDFTHFWKIFKENGHIPNKEKALQREPAEILRDAAEYHQALKDARKEADDGRDN